MRYTARSRDRSKNLLALLTGAATFGTVAATGAVTGVAAHRSALDAQAREEADAFRTASARAAAGRAAQRIPWSRVVTVVKDRPRAHRRAHRGGAPGQRPGRGRSRRGCPARAPRRTPRRRPRPARRGRLGDPGTVPAAAARPGARTGARAGTGARPEQRLLSPVPRPRRRPVRRDPHRRPGRALGGARHLRAPRRPGTPAPRRSPSGGRGRARRGGPHLQPLPRRLRPHPGQRPPGAVDRRSTRCWSARSRVAVEAAAATGGLVDPCLGRTLVGIGYDADLRGRAAAHGPRSPAGTPEPTTGRWREIRTDPDGALRVPAGCALDLGATAKAWAADLVAAAVVEDARRGTSWSASAATSGSTAPATDGAGLDGAGHRAPRRRPGAAEVVALGGGGLATSSTLARRWRTRDGGERHHLVDPRTGRPTDEHWRTVTATGRHLRRRQRRDAPPPWCSARTRSPGSTTTASAPGWSAATAR